MAPKDTIIMQEFCADNPDLASKAIARDAVARKYFGLHNFALYDQGSAKVIGMRAAAPAAGVAATYSLIQDSRKVHCSICNKEVHDFARHNRETRILDPGKTFYCPYEECTKSITRDGQITIDHHLANCHIDFRNTGGRGGELLERSDKTSVLGKLSTSGAQYVAQHRQSQILAYEQRRAQLVQDFIEAEVDYPKLAAATLPQALHQGAVDCHILKKDQAVAHAILARKTIKAWDAIFVTAKEMLP